MKNTSLFPSIEIDITGPMGNAYCIIGVVSTCLKEIGYSKDEIQTIIDDMMSSDYEHLLTVAKRYVTIKR
jgi:hypothetical protein